MYNALRIRNLSYDVFEDIKREEAERSLWMKIINTNDSITESAIVDNFILIDWKTLLRPLSEDSIRRFKSRVINWNDQLAVPRTFEFLIEFQEKFDWNELSKNLPKWFNDVYIQYFSNRLNWNHMTMIIDRLNDHTIYLVSDKLNWSWITKNYIPSEAFAFRFRRNILWDDKDIMITNLDTEFIYDINEIRKLGAECCEYMIAPHITKYKKMKVVIDSTFAKSFDEIPIILGKSIGRIFINDHKDRIDFTELLQRDLLNDDNLNDL